METVIVNNKETLDELYNDSALTLEGLSTTEKNLGELLKWVNERTPIKRDRIYIVSGSLMNMAYHLTGDNAYPEKDCSLVCIKLDDLEKPMSITLARFEIGGRWFDDIVDNNARRENEKH